MTLYAGHVPPKTVLVVEDYDVLRELFADALSTLGGFSVRQAANGMDGLRAAESNPPDAIVLDLGLPHVTGYDVLHALKQHPHTKEIPVIIVTGTNEIVEGVRAGCVLRKPVDPTELVRVLHKYLED